MRKNKKAIEKPRKFKQILEEFKIETVLYKDGSGFFHVFEKSKLIYADCKWHCILCKEYGDYHDWQFEAAEQIRKYQNIQYLLNNAVLVFECEKRTEEYKNTCKKKEKN